VLAFVVDQDAFVSCWFVLFGVILVVWHCLPPSSMYLLLWSVFENLSKVILQRGKFICTLTSLQFRISLTCADVLFTLIFHKHRVSPHTPSQATAAQQALLQGAAQGVQAARWKKPEMRNDICDVLYSEYFMNCQHTTGSRNLLKSTCVEL
jgi:hypothetical protein